MVLVIDSRPHGRRIKNGVLLGTCMLWIVSILSPVWINISTRLGIVGIKPLKKTPGHVQLSFSRNTNT